ncbi:hypothetical protein JS520_00225 [Candidatus Vidania fulgoroideae]|nr:hypothetical protein JS520_00225 [Candidatus Vidania fulgoroideae]
MKTRFVFSLSRCSVSALLNLFFLHYFFSVVFNGCFSVRFTTVITYAITTFYTFFASLGFTPSIKFSNTNSYLYRLYLICKRFLKIRVFHICYCINVCSYCCRMSSFECLYLLKKLRCNLSVFCRCAFFIRLQRSMLYPYNLLGCAIICRFNNNCFLFNSCFCNAICDRIEKHTSVFFFDPNFRDCCYLWFWWFYNFTYSKYLLGVNYTFTSLCYFTSSRSITHLLNLRFFIRCNEPRMFTIAGCLNRLLTVSFIKKLACCWFLVVASFYSFSFLKQILFAFFLIESYHHIYLLVVFLKLFIINLYLYAWFYIDNYLRLVRVIYIVFSAVGWVCFFLRWLPSGVVITYGVFVVDNYLSTVVAIPVFYVCRAKLVLYNVNANTMTTCIFFFPFLFNFYVAKVRDMVLGFFCLYNICGRYVIKEILLLRSIL